MRSRRANSRVAGLSLPTGLTDAEIDLCRYFASMAAMKRISGVAPLIWASRVKMGSGRAFDSNALVHFASFANSFGLCWPSQREVAAVSSMSVDRL
jgi:hypothetical protein